MKTYIILLEDRKVLEEVEGMTFESEWKLADYISNLIDGDEELENTLGYYELSDFMDLVNDKRLDYLTDTFIGYAYVVKP